MRQRPSCCDPGVPQYAPLLSVCPAGNRASLCRDAVILQPSLLYCGSFWQGCVSCSLSRRHRVPYSKAISELETVGLMSPFCKIHDNAAQGW